MCSASVDGPQRAQRVVLWLQGPSAIQRSVSTPHGCFSVVPDAWNLGTGGRCGADRHTGGYWWSLDPLGIPPIVDDTPMDDIALLASKADELGMTSADFPMIDDKFMDEYLGMQDMT